MINNPETIKKICDNVTKYTIYFVVFLTPIFFLPFTTDYFDFNKQILLIVLVFVALIPWMLKFLMLGGVEIKKTSILLPLGVFFASSVLSTIFSVYRYGSFWGWPQPISESLMTVSFFCLLYFLISNNFEKSKILFLAKLLVSSIVISSIFSCIMIGFSGFGFGFLTTLGSPAGIGLMCAILLPLLVSLLVVSKKLWRVLFFIGIFSFATIFVFVNYTLVWCIVLASSAITMVFGIFKKNIFDTRWLALPMFFLTISVFFLVLNPQIKWLPSAGNEIFLNQKTSFAVAGSTLNKSPVFGSGLGTFSYDFLKYKNKDLSSSSLWNVVFDKSGSKILTLLATGGALGVLSFLAFILFTIFYTGKYLFLRDHQESHYWILISGIVTSVVAYLLSSFLYSSSFALDFACFILLAFATGLIFENKKDYQLKQNSFKMLSLVFLFTVIFIFGIGLIIIDGQKYFAEMSYKTGIEYWQKGLIDQSIEKLEMAVSNNPKLDVYFSQLSQAYIVKLQKDLSDSKISQDQKTKEIQFFSTNAINASTIATTLNPQNANNWSIRGYIYQNLMSVSADALPWAEKSYQQALVLDPNNPYLLMQLGVLSYQKKDYANAEVQFNKAIALNSGFAEEIKKIKSNIDAGNKVVEPQSETKIPAKK